MRISQALRLVAIAALSVPALAQAEAAGADLAARSADLNEAVHVQARASAVDPPAKFGQTKSGRPCKCLAAESGAGKHLVTRGGNDPGKCQKCGRDHHLCHCNARAPPVRLLHLLGLVPPIPLGLERNVLHQNQPRARRGIGRPAAAQDRAQGLLGVADQVPLGCAG
ncbi:hypothetical protein PpBr36_05276 [Pyricularia pennisetigena]|uniref:hypothetical protein n=1 Tax=Pyricularia pennisetigena TaxID=1578925 RepID=UPI00114D510C|nr:hypothetical protein PpBr36_05276 [Pyricularia pennisetigena]TLS26197.1 hypothetical protein PpBr36_05276 [Pyricularia pennisetigena]